MQTFRRENVLKWHQSFILHFWFRRDKHFITSSHWSPIRWYILLNKSWKTLSCLIFLNPNFLAQVLPLPFSFCYTTLWNFENVDYVISKLSLCKKNPSFRNVPLPSVSLAWQSVYPFFCIRLPSFLILFSLLYPPLTYTMDQCPAEFCMVFKICAYVVFALLAGKKKMFAIWKLFLIDTYQKYFFADWMRWWEKESKSEK